MRLNQPLRPSQQQQQEQQHRQSHADRQRIDHLLRFAFVVDQIEQARPKAEHDGDEASDDEDFDHGRDRCNEPRSAVRGQYIVMTPAQTDPAAGRRFRPSVFSIVLTLLGVALFVRLGFWQLDRAEQKQALVSQYEIGQRSQVEIVPQNAASLPRYQRARVSGYYDPAHQILLDNMPSHSGQPGYRVLTPLQTSSGWLLVDRGWLPLGASRTALPDIAVGSEERSITGTTDALPRAGLQLDTPPVDASAPWPRVLSFPQQPTLEQQLKRKLLPGVLLLDPSQPDGYERVWEAHLGFMPQRHIGYAVQWFALAAVAVVIFILLGFRTNKGSQ